MSAALLGETLCFGTLHAAWSRRIAGLQTELMPVLDAQRVCHVAVSNLEFYMARLCTVCTRLYVQMSKRDLGAVCMGCSL